MGFNKPEDICNLALTQLGQESIDSLTAPGPKSELCNRFYSEARDWVLRKHPWNCALVRVELDSDDEYLPAPAWGYTSAFKLPTDFLRMHKVQYPSDKWAIEGQTLVCNASSINITYIRSMSTVSHMDPMLAQAIAYKLAMMIAPKLIGTSTEKSQSLMREYKEIIADAKLQDCIESEVERAYSGTLLNARYGSEGDEPFRPFESV